MPTPHPDAWPLNLIPAGTPQPNIDVENGSFVDELPIHMLILRIYVSLQEGTSKVLF